MREIHRFKKFSVSVSVGGDYVIETDDGEEILILSPSGSSEHQKMSGWIESSDRTEDDFEEYRTESK